MELSKEKKAIESIKNDMKLLYGQHSIVSNEDLKILLQLLEKQSKVIDEMAEHLKFLCGGLEIVRGSLNIENYSKEEIKQYFYRKVEEDD